MITQISETRQPFDRRHNRSCVYYGIRGNTRSQYAFDKSCVLEGLGTGVMPVIVGPMPTLLGDSEMPHLLGGRMPTFLGSAADVVVLNQFLSMLLTNPKASVYVSKGEGSGAGMVADLAFIVIPTGFNAQVGDALVAAGNARIELAELTTPERFIPDARGRLGSASTLIPIVKSALQTLQGGGMSTRAKVLIGVGAAAVLGGLAVFALKKGAGTSRRRRRR